MAFVALVALVAWGGGGGIISLYFILGVLRKIQDDRAIYQIINEHAQCPVCTHQLLLLHALVGVAVHVLLLSVKLE